MADEKTTVVETPEIDAASREYVYENRRYVGMKETIWYVVYDMCQSFNIDAFNDILSRSSVYFRRFNNICFFVCQKIHLRRFCDKIQGIIHHTTNRESITQLLIYFNLLCDFNGCNKYQNKREFVVQNDRYAKVM